MKAPVRRLHVYTFCLQPHLRIDTTHAPVVFGMLPIATDFTFSIPMADECIGGGPLFPRVFIAFLARR